MITTTNQFDFFITFAWQTALPGLPRLWGFKQKLRGPKKRGFVFLAPLIYYESSASGRTGGQARLAGCADICRQDGMNAGYAAGRT